MTNREKSEAIFKAMEKYGDYRIFVEINNKTWVLCHGVSMKHVFVNHWKEPKTVQVWVEDIEDVTACHACCDRLYGGISIF